MQVYVESFYFPLFSSCLKYSFYFYQENVLGNNGCFLKQYFQVQISLSKMRSYCPMIHKLRKWDYPRKQWSFVHFRESNKFLFKWVWSIHKYQILLYVARYLLCHQSEDIYRSIPSESWCWEWIFLLFWQWYSGLHGCLVRPSLVERSCCWVSEFKTYIQTINRAVGILLDVWSCYTIYFSAFI